MTDRRKRSLCFQNEFKPCVGTFQRKEDALRVDYSVEQSSAVGTYDAGRPQGWEQGLETPDAGLCLAWEEKKMLFRSNRNWVCLWQSKLSWFMFLTEDMPDEQGKCLKGPQMAFVAHSLPPPKVVIFKIWASFYKMPITYEVSTVIWCLCTGYYLMSFKKLAFLKMVAGANTHCVSPAIHWLSQESEAPFEMNLRCLSLSRTRNEPQIILVTHAVLCHLSLLPPLVL